MGKRTRVQSGVYHVTLRRPAKLNKIFVTASPRPADWDLAVDRSGGIDVPVNNPMQGGQPLEELARNPAIDMRSHMETLAAGRNALGEISSLSASTSLSKS
jgi:hypothetical protein